MKTLLLLGLTIAASSVAYADLPAPGQFTVGDQFKVNSLIDMNYGYNFNHPSINAGNVNNVGQNPQRFNDTGNNQFLIQQATVGLSHEAKSVGFNFAIGAGHELDKLNTVDNVTSPTFRYIRHADVSWSHDDLTIKFGRIDTEFGMERIDTPENWNYSRSLLFTTMDPYFTTGVDVKYAFNSNWYASIGAANGENRFVDNNAAKTIPAKIGYVAGKTSATLAYMTGPEYNNGDWRNTVGFNAKTSVTDEALVGVDAIYVHGETDPIDNVAVPDRATTSRYGVAAYGSFSFLADAWETLRFEYLYDKGGGATLSGSGPNQGANAVGVVTPIATLNNVVMYEVTATHRQMLTKNLSGWFEVRYDHGNNLFTDNSGTVKDAQITLLAGATFAL